MGRKTSVYLSDELSERMKASPRKHADLLASALDADAAGASTDAVTLADLREELAAQDDRVRRIVRDELGRVAGHA
jgi:hypothetical protein